MGRAVPITKLARGLLLLLVCCSACGPIVKEPTLLDSPEYDASLLRTKYEILPGDELEIRFFYTRELDVTLPVRPDGYILLPYVGDIRAEGKTPEILAGELKERYAKELKQPEIAVIVHSFSANQIHVGGRVDAPGVFPLSGPMRVLDSLFAAGGYDPEALLSEVLVIRRTRDKLLVIPVNLEEALDGTDAQQNIRLQPYDAVYVPSSSIADVNTWVDLYIRKNIPFNFGVRLALPI
jgi:protein involved in polysaccharide export with SLBB domain